MIIHERFGRLIVRGRVPETPRAHPTIRNETSTDTNMATTTMMRMETMMDKRRTLTAQTDGQ